jgi:hypothetical protein
MGGTTTAQPPGAGAERASRKPARWSRRGRTVWLALAAVVLLALVSVGSLRRPPGASGGSAHFPSALLETLGLLLFLAALAGSVLAVWALLPAKREEAPRRRNPVVAPLVILLFVLVVAVLRRLGWLEGLALPGVRLNPTQSTGTPPLTTLARPLPRDGPRWLPFVVVGVLLLGMAVAVLVRSEQARRRRAALFPPGELAVLLDHTLGELEHETDPRRAVIAAWIRMEHGLAAAGLPRLAAEAPFEYAARVLERTGVRPASVRRLTDLFERAKFSQHTIDEGMRRAAVEAVTVIRQELQAEQARIEAAAAAAGAGR